MAFILLLNALIAFVVWMIMISATADIFTIITLVIACLARIGSGYSISNRPYTSLGASRGLLVKDSRFVK